MLPPRAVFLVGFMGAGKTSVGRVLATALGWPFEDLDDRIELREQRSVEEIFRQSGENEFRRAEHEALRAVVAELGSTARIVALGGGAFVQPENGPLLDAAGVRLVFLDASPEELFRRCAQQVDKRPLRRDWEQFSQLYEKRRAHYLQAGLRIDTSGQSVETVAAEVARRLGLEQMGSKE
jgi:shikimate kinase